MGLRINTNVGALAAQNQLQQTTRRTQTEMKQLASGSRFADLTEGAGDFAIAEHLRGQVSGLQSAKMNAENANSFIQVAEGGLNEQNNILIRQRELAVQAASDTFSNDDRENIDKEFQQLGQELDRIAKSTRFGSHRLLTGEEKQYEFQVGAYKGAENVVKYTSNTDTTASALDVAGLDVTSKGDAEDALDSIDSALQKVAEARASFGAMQSRLNSTSSSLGQQIETLEEAHSRIADTDVASVSSRLAKDQALQQYQVQVLQQANQYPGSVLKLMI